jgi:hypothetical protein
VLLCYSEEPSLADALIGSVKTKNREKMGFFVGLIMGLAVGLALIVGFVKYENARSNSRTQLANTIAAFARMTVDDSRKILSPDRYPSWVVFSQRQKLSSRSFSVFQVFCRFLWVCDIEADFLWVFVFFSFGYS